jgi:hypothetical protein
MPQAANIFMACNLGDQNLSGYYNISRNRDKNHLYRCTYEWLGILTWYETATLRKKER